jgi:hypothetical protein
MRFNLLPWHPPKWMKSRKDMGVRDRGDAVDQVEAANPTSKTDANRTRP